MEFVGVGVGVSDAVVSDRYIGVKRIVTRWVASWFGGLGWDIGVKRMVTRWVASWFGSVG